MIPVDSKKRPIYRPPENVERQANKENKWQMLLIATAGIWKNATTEKKGRNTGNIVSKLCIEFQF